MFPLYDENPSVRLPLTTIALIIGNGLVWLLLQQLGSSEGLARSICQHGLIAGELLQRVPPGSSFALDAQFRCVLDGSAGWLTLFSSMYMHVGWMHLIGNMWFLWVFGDNVEDAMGHSRFLLFYLLCGLAAAAAQIATNPASTVPMVGASGAIGGVMGAYARLYPRARIQMLVILGFYVTRVAVPALFMLGYWLLLQLLGALPALGRLGGGVAFWAHIGGFAAGVVLAGPLTRADYLQQHLRQPPRRGARYRF